MLCNLFQGNKNEGETSALINLPNIYITNRFVEVNANHLEEKHRNDHVLLLPEGNQYLYPLRHSMALPKVLLPVEYSDHCHKTVTHGYMNKLMEIRIFGNNRRKEE